MATAGISAGEAWKYHHSRSQRLVEELRYALRNVSRNDVAACIEPIPGDAVRAAIKRGRKLLSFAGLALRVVSGEVFQLVNAACEGRSKPHLKKRGVAIQRQLKRSTEDLRRSLKELPNIARAARRQPSEVLPELVGAILGLAAGSGGLDANGGIPDLDLLFGVGAHRSVLTHTMIIGIGTECVALSLSRLISLVHAKLPANHDPVWDQLLAAAHRTLYGAAAGTSLGLGFHLLADGTLQVGALHGLGIDLPIEAHQALIGLSGAAEAGVGFERLRLANRRMRANARCYHVLCGGSDQIEVTKMPGSQSA